MRYMVQRDYILSMTVISLARDSGHRLGSHCNLPLTLAATVSQNDGMHSTLSLTINLTRQSINWSYYFRDYEQHKYY